MFSKDIKLKSSVSSVSCLKISQVLQYSYLHPWVFGYLRYVKLYKNRMFVYRVTTGSVKEVLVSQSEVFFPQFLVSSASKTCPWTCSTV